MKNIWADYKMMRQYRNARWRSIIKAILMSAGKRVYLSPRLGFIYRGPDRWSHG
jgi:hypothetical protein